MDLVRIDSIICRDYLSIDKFIEIAQTILEKNGVDKSIVVDENRKVVENEDLCIVLKKLGARYVPISREKSENIYVSLEALGFFDDIEFNRFKVFRNTEELLYRNWPTPLVKLVNSSIKNRIAWAKLEGFNPWSMSIKDRIGWYMYKKAVEKLNKNTPKILVEATSTNTGLALASIASIHGSKLKAYIPSTVSQTGELLLKIFGVEVIRSSKQLTVELIKDVEETAKIDKALHLNQFYNDANLEVHLRYTAKELELQIKEAGISPKAIIGSLGTSGHLSAITLYFKNRFKNIKIYGVVPAQGSVIQGIRRIESGMKWIHYVKLDKIIEVTLEEAIESIINIVRKDGIFVGLSSGAVYAAYKTLVEENIIDEGDYILILPDHGFKYIEQITKYIERKDICWTIETPQKE